ncbi:hypothetical protein B0H13DRAFT_1850296 [Mycena leptocephala]|nr:hypothetical protein B0H13DRAFT_1850296 [Mycena leptocephala]
MLAHIAAGSVLPNVQIITVWWADHSPAIKMFEQRQASQTYSTITEFGLIGGDPHWGLSTEEIESVVNLMAVDVFLGNSLKIRPAREAIEKHAWLDLRAVEAPSLAIHSILPTNSAEPIAVSPDSRFGRGYSTWSPAAITTSLRTMIAQQLRGTRGLIQVQLVPLMRSKHLESASNQQLADVVPMAREHESRVCDLDARPRVLERVSVHEMSKALAAQFKVIDSDHENLKSTIKEQAAAQAKLNKIHGAATADLQATIRALEMTIGRLQLAPILPHTRPPSPRRIHPRSPSPGESISQNKRMRGTSMEEKPFIVFGPVQILGSATPVDVLKIYMDASCSMNLAPAPKTPYATAPSVHKLLKREVAAVEPKMEKIIKIGAGNPAAVSANAWPSPIPEASVSRVYDASIARGCNGNQASSRLPQCHPRQVHLQSPIAGIGVLNGAQKTLQKPVKFICTSRSAAHSLAIAIDGGGLTSRNAISMPADPQVHGPSNGPLGSSPGVFHVSPLSTAAIKPPSLLSILLATVVLVFIACAFTEAQNSKLCNNSCLAAFFLATVGIFNRLARQTLLRAVGNQ